MRVKIDPDALSAATIVYESVVRERNIRSSWIGYRWKGPKSDTAAIIRAYLKTAGGES